MKRIAAVALGFLLAATAAWGQQNPEVAKGFSADKTYDFSNLDAINLFNGSVTLPVPIGQTYNVGPNLSYRFTLVYTGNNWQLESNTWYANDTDGYPTIETKANYYEPFGIARPAGLGDAGLGWQVTLGSAAGGQIDHDPDSIGGHGVLERERDNAVFVIVSKRALPARQLNGRADLVRSPEEDGRAAARNVTDDDLHWVQLNARLHWIRGIRGATQYEVQQHGDSRAQNAKRADVGSLI